MSYSLPVDKLERRFPPSSPPVPFGSSITGATYISRKRTARPVLALFAGVLAAGCLAFGAHTASAAVQVDPNGPAGQQYALPLDAARGESAGNPLAGVPGADAPPPLFGQGISPAGRSGGSVDQPGGRRADGPGGNGKDGFGNSRSRTGEFEARGESRTLTSGPASSSTPELLALIAAVSIIGLTAGLVARRAL